MISHGTIVQLMQPSCVHLLLQFQTFTFLGNSRLLFHIHRSRTINKLWQRIITMFLPLSDKSGLMRSTQWQIRSFVLSSDCEMIEKWCITSTLDSIIEFFKLIIICLYPETSINKIKLVACCKFPQKFKVRLWFRVVSPFYVSLYLLQFFCWRFLKTEIYLLS